MKVDPDYAMFLGGLIGGCIGLILTFFSESDDKFPLIGGFLVGVIIGEIIALYIKNK